MSYWVSNCEDVHNCIGSTVGPNIFIKICAWSTAQISRELIVQVKEEFGKIPKKIKLLNCVGGGSSAMGFWNEFMDTDAEFVGIEAGGPKNSKLHAAPLTNGSKIGILHGAAQYVIQNKEGQIGSTESISAGLDYPGISPLHCFLKDTKRARYTSASDEEALKAYQLVSKLENISPSLEPSHAFAEAIKIAPKLKSSDVIIVNSCGDSLKDKDIIKQKLGIILEMKSKISLAFEKCKKEKRPALITYTVAGDNTKNNSLKILNTISKHADILELGFPHNTPIADGGQIQESSHRALKNGIKLKDVFKL